MEQADKLAEIVKAADLSEREAAILALMLDGVTHYVQIAEALGVAPTVACTARTRLRRKLTVAAAEAEQRARQMAQDAKDADALIGAHGFYSALLECFGNTRNANPRTPAFKNVKQDRSGVLTGEAAVLRGELVTPDDLIRARCKAV